MSGWRCSGFSSIITFVPSPWDGGGDDLLCVGACVGPIKGIRRYLQGRWGSAYRTCRRPSSPHVDINLATRGADWSWPSPTRIEYETHGILFLALPRTISLLGMATTAWQLTRHPTGDMACSEPQGLRSRSEKEWTNVVCALRTQVNSLSPCLAVAVLVLLHIFLLVSC